ncbi:MAG TPA: hypothetical protein VGO11_10070 [Chthoniobacteraceae bacterium]|jgi:hypothetical protein|nr:hypothetical protein [Chthoniobacteraceae bacterium]
MLSLLLLLVVLLFAGAGLLLLAPRGAAAPAARCPPVSRGWWLGLPAILAAGGVFFILQPRRHSGDRPGPAEQEQTAQNTHRSLFSPLDGVTPSEPRPPENEPARLENAPPATAPQERQAEVRRLQEQAEAAERQQQAAAEREQRTATERERRVAAEREEFDRVLQAIHRERDAAWKGSNPSAAAAASSRGLSRLEAAYRAVDDPTDEIREQYRFNRQQFGYDLKGAGVWAERSSLQALFASLPQGYPNPKAASNDHERVLKATQHYGKRLNEIPAEWEWGSRTPFAQYYQERLNQCNNWGAQIQAWDVQARNEAAQRKAGEDLGRALSGVLLKKMKH